MTFRMPDNFLLCGFGFFILASLKVEGNCSKLGKAANGFDEIDEIAAIDQTVALQIWENAKTRGRGRPARERVRVQLRGVGVNAAVGRVDLRGPSRERRLAKFRKNVARFRLYRLRFLQENMHFAAFFKIYQII